MEMFLFFSKRKEKNFVEMKKNLVFFLARFGKGGAGNSVFRLVTSLDQKKYNISVICLNSCAYEKNFLDKGVDVFKIKTSRILFSISKLKKILSEIKKNNRETILISNINYTNLICAIFIKKEKNLKLLAIERTPLKELEIYFNLIDFIKKKIMSFLLPFYYRRFDKIICNSKYMSNYLRKKYNIKSEVVFPPSIINHTKIKKNVIKINKNLHILSICRLSKEKKIDELIHALKYLDDIKFEVKIIGDGAEKPKLKNLIERLNLNKSVKLLGFKKNVYDYLKKTDLYINTSSFEGFPNSVVEAAFCGIPIISSQSHGGINEILLNGKGGIIYHNGPSELAKEIKKFYNNNSILRKKATLAKKNSYKYNLSNHKRNFETIINKI